MALEHRTPFAVAALVWVTLVLTGCGAPTIESANSSFPEVATSTTAPPASLSGTSSAPTSSIDSAATTTTGTTIQTTITTAPLATTPATTSSPSGGFEGVDDECVAFVEERLAATQRQVDEYASMSLAELAALPEAPDVLNPWWSEPVEVEKVTGLVPYEEYYAGLTPDERAAEDERTATERLRAGCQIDAYLRPFLETARIDLRSPAGAVTWANGYLIEGVSLLFGGQISPEVVERYDSQFVEPPEPTPPNLPDPEATDCASLGQLALRGVQSSIDTYSWVTSSEALESWGEAIDLAASRLGCAQPFLIRTVVSNGHTLKAEDLAAAQLRASVIYGSWEHSWESFQE